MTKDNVEGLLHKVISQAEANKMWSPLDIDEPSPQRCVPRNLAY